MHVLLQASEVGLVCQYYGGISDDLISKLNQESIVIQGNGEGTFNKCYFPQGKLQRSANGNFIYIHS